MGERRGRKKSQIPAIPNLASRDTGEVVYQKPKLTVPVDHETNDPIPGLNRGPYTTWSWDTPLVEQIEHVLAHLDGLPCPGCKDATRLLMQYRERTLNESPTEFKERLAEVQEEVDAGNRRRALEAEEERRVREGAEEDKPFT